jgi:hypothetical protein
LKSKKTIILISAILLSMSIPAVISEDVNLGVEYVFEPVMIDSQWMIENTQVQSMPGEPLMPYRAASILLPQGATLKNVKVKHSKPTVQGGFNLPWGQPPCTFSDTPVEVGRNEAIYNSMNWYPEKLFKIVGVESCRGFDILNVILYPVQYQPKSGTVKFYKKLTVEVQFGNGMKNKLYRGLAADKTAVAGMIDNVGVISTYSDGPNPLATEEYIIITNDTMKSTFQELADWKAGFVNGTGVYTVSWITSNYTGVDNAEKIRNFIIDWYTNHGLKYVLLGGDVSAVPYRGFYIYAGGYTDYDMLADMYFSHLDGSWNDDGDSYWAEPGEEDWYAEIAVGRAPCETVTEADNFVNKVMEYEKKDKPHRVLLHSSQLTPDNNPDSRCLPWNCDDWLPGDYYIDYLMEGEQTITKAVWIEHWGYNPVAVEHCGHGNTDVYYINYSPTVSWHNSDVASLTNTFWPWHTSVACICGQIEANDCLAEAYVMDPDNGAIATIFNDNYGWYSTLDACMYSGEFCEMEFRACFTDGYEELGNLLNQARSYLASSASSNSTYRWCFYERNLVGDPESSCLTKRESVNCVSITYPSNGQTVSGPITVATLTQGCIETVEFYIDGVLKYTDTTSPFEYYFDPCPLKEDENMTISVKGYCSGVLTDEDSVTVYVDCDIAPYITITDPAEGQEVSGTVTCQADSNCDSVKWYINGVFKTEETSAPFQYSWNTTLEAEDANSTVKAEGYIGGVYKVQDSVTVFVNNDPGECLGTTILSLLMLLGSGILRRR